MKKILIFRLFLFLLVLTSCGNGLPRSKEGILSEKQMVEMLLDTHLADALLFVENSPSNVKSDKGLFYYPSILEKYGITKAQMDSSVVWYMRNPAAYARIYQKVVKDLEQRQAAVKKNELTE